ADQRKQQLASLDALGDLYLTVGNLAEGRKAIERQQAIATRMAEKEPDNALWQGDVAASTFKLAGVLSDQGESTTALAAYEKALGIRQALALADPQNADKRALQASAQLQIGALYKLQGDNARALASYEAARDIVSKLADARPDSEALRATLMRSLRLIGEIQQEAKQYKEAAASYRAELDLAEKLAAAKPDDPARQAHLADAYQDIGSIENDLIDRSKYTETGTEPALAAFNRSIDISRALIAADARNAAYQRQLAMTLGKLGMLRYFGDSNITRDDSEAARNAFQEAIEINERLVAADPGNKLWVGDMVGAYESMATWNEFQPDEQAALSYTKKAHQSALQLAALDPKNVAWQRKASLYHAKIAESYIQMKDYKAALDYEIKGLEYAIGVARANPGLPVYFNDVSAVQSRISRIYWIQKDMNNYWAQNDTLLEQTKRNVGRFPEDADALEHLYRAYVTVAKSWTKNEPDKAIGLFRDSLAVAQKAAALYPDDVRHLSGIYEAEINAAYVIEQKGDRQAAHDAYAAALATARRRVALKSGDAGYEAGVAHAQARLDIVDSGQPPPKFD
ncbi:tetratricopeptide repeat protein, partial [Salmonella enterica subsp. enterica]|nr:tetratricopeptide repeat protein [Salmonella enterica subsp. enterica]